MEKKYNAIPTETLVSIMEDIGRYRQLGGTWDDIRFIIKKEYNVCPIDMEKKFQFLDKLGQIQVVCDSKTTLDKIAKAKQVQLINQKILVKQRNLINAEANTEAFRQMIGSILQNYKGKNHPKLILPKKVVSAKTNTGIFIIADEHFKGEMDTDHLLALYDSIEYDIKKYNYTNVELGYLGDGIDGLIHKGSLASNDGAITPAITYCNILIERVNKIKQVNRILFVNKSNHTQTRPLGTSRNELAREDIGLMIGEMLRYGLRPDIQLVCDEIIRVGLNHFNVALLHGHQPYCVTKEKMLSYGNEQYNYVPNLTIMGHYHTYKINEYGKNKWLVVAPTAKSFNGDYEQSQGFVSYGQYLILTIEDNIPQFKVREVKR